jgi:catechol 2,3-dioxygenase-like lactoylglutathione lyase family enzyme
MPIFTHLTVGADDIKKGREFYDAVLGPLGYKRLFDTDDRSGYGTQAPEFMVVKPINGKAASGGNGQTVGFQAPNRAAVNEFHKQALARGGKCEGPPGPRPVAPNFYAAYVRDPAGNKLVAITMNAE